MINTKYPDSPDTSNPIREHDCFAEGNPFRTYYSMNYKQCHICLKKYPIRTNDRTKIKHQR